ncbi:MAG: ATP-dependent helicase [Chloroflexota bacterium]
MDILDGLNPAQREAVTAAVGPILVLAGPGSGKTRVLTHRVAHLVQARGVRPWHIMAVTFTNKAAGEMRSRLGSLIGGSLNQLSIGTFHAICVRLLRREHQAAGLDRDFAILDDSDQLAVAHQAVKELNLDDKQYRPRAMLNAISRAKNELIGPADYPSATYWQEVARRVYERYQDILRENNGLDFDDLLMQAVLLFRQNDDVLHTYRQRYAHLLADEWQDTNTAQYELVRLLGSGHRSVFVVGDEDQSIYRFRGADYRNVARFRQDFAEARVILLEQNYRSTQTILDVANAVIAGNLYRTPKHLHTDQGAGPRIVLHEAYNEADEAQFVIQTIRQLERDRLARPGDCAVMYRTNAQSRALEDAFVYAGLPYKLVGATRFYARREIKDVLAYLRIVHNPRDGISLGRVLNVPPRGIGARTIGALTHWAEQTNQSAYDALQLLKSPAGSAADIPLSARARRSLLDFAALWDELIAARNRMNALDLLDTLLERTGYARWVQDGSQEGQDRWQNIMELRTVAQEYADLPPEAGLTTFLEEVALVSDTDDLEESVDAPTLLTLHSAKGLEFPAVFIVGLEEGILPHSRSLDEPEEMEEERRLCYVGITRAKKHLYLVYTFRRTLYGASDVSAPSRFLQDIPGHLIAGRDRSDTERGRSDSSARAVQRMTTWNRTAAQPARRAAATEFQPGDRVQHPAFGEGTVIESQTRGDDEEVTVAFVGRGIKRLVASLAQLTKA